MNIILFALFFSVLIFAHFFFYAFVIRLTVLFFGKGRFKTELILLVRDWIGEGFFPLDYLRASLIKDIMRECRNEDGSLDAGQFFSTVGFHVAYGHLSKEIMRELLA